MSDKQLKLKGKKMSVKQLKLKGKKMSVKQLKLKGKKMSVKQLKFTCPKCGKHKLTRSENQVNIITGIYEINSDGNIGYEIPIFHTDPNPKKGTDWTSFYCKGCDFWVEDDEGVVNSHKRLVKWIKKNCPQD